MLGIVRLTVEHTDCHHTLYEVVNIAEDYSISCRLIWILQIHRLDLHALQDWLIDGTTCAFVPYRPICVSGTVFSRFIQDPEYLP